MSEEAPIVIVGGGLAGLAAGIRLAHFGRRVELFERHALPGGLNSWYPRHGAPGGLLDTGLHALTNAAPPEQRNAPLNRILRQLRLRRDDLRLCPQSHSRIRFPDAEYPFDNDFDAFRHRLEAAFPDERDGLAEALARIRAAAYADTAGGTTANTVLAQCIRSRRLRDILRFPAMYYGCPTPGDMAFGDYATMFQSVMLEGLARPQGGMRPFLGLLVRRFTEAGGQLRLGNGIRRLECTGGRVAAAIDDRGERHPAAHVVSTAGARETAALLDEPPRPLASCRPGQMRFLEAIFTLDDTPAALGCDDCIAFVSTQPEFDYRAPDNADAPPASLLLCAPANYQGAPPDRLLRLSAITTAEWAAAPDYPDAKTAAAQRLLAAIAPRWPRLAARATLLDCFTPRTIQRFTGHANGAIYGSPDKLRDGKTGLPNLTIAGTDQGLLGIVGAMLSGILAANQILA